MSIYPVSAAQRALLNAASQEIPRLYRLTSAAHVHALTAYEWQCAAGIAAGIADQLANVAALATTAEQAEHWTAAVQCWQGRTIYYELWSGLAEITPEIVEQHQEQP